MRKREKINDLFNKIHQEFFIGKRHLMSCERVEQARSTSEWMSDVNDKWDNLINMVCKGLSSRSAEGVIYNYHKLNESMAEEWRVLCDQKMNELTPREPEVEERKYPPIVVVRGFDE